MTRSHRLPALVLAAALALSLVACSDDDGDDAASSGDPSTTTEAADGGADDGSTTESTDGGSEEEAEPAEDPYDGHTSEIYDQDVSWICRPDLADDECRDLDVTVVAPDGTTTVEEREPAADPPIDCFYVYPTVSADPPPLADLEWTPEDNEARTVVAQAAQYAQTCRVFAPVYRQIPLAGLGQASEEARATAYGDVLDAWQTYISQWNDGRGVILIGHSQGTGHLTKLIAEEIDGVPALQDRLVSAHLFGGSIQAPEGELAGGAFQEIPACTAADEAGCVVTWSSYPAANPPGADGIFGRSGEDGRALCVDPLELLGEEHGNPVAPVNGPLVGGVGVEGDFSTPFISLPDGTDLSCESTADHDYLAVATADDARPLDSLTVETLGHTWGLHLFDMTVALDDLVALAQRQADAYAQG